MLFEIIFWVLFVLIFGKLISFAIRMAWGLLQVALILVAMPLMLLAMVMGGMLMLAFPFLAFIGLVTLISAISKTAKA